MFWQREKTPIITSGELSAAIEADNSPIIVDVRSEKDFQAAHLPGAINIPLEDLERRKAELDETKVTVFY